MDTRSTEYYEDIQERLYTSVLADVMDELGYRRQVMDHRIRPLFPEARVVGRAATMLAGEVYDVPAEPFKLEMELLDSLEPGEVVVCTTQGSLHAAMWGELLSTHTQAKGGRGAVMDGLTRDSWGIIDIRFPVFAAGLSPADSKGAWTSWRSACRSSAAGSASSQATSSSPTTTAASPCRRRSRTR